MDYELCKRLKDAGFPQYGNNREIDGSLATVSASREEKYDWNVYVPLLEELIEACGGRFGTLDWGRTHYGAGDKVWIATDNEEEGVDEQRAPTPTSAVAMLWLALNTSKKV